ncbi:(2S)-3-sulfopropanediol dehydratase activating enzyme [Desulfitobacterium sp. AusDCA]|uniref:(2S)-3-sulfopropanediol dehydratase activating enzyme n=1 Tax=Desulfitobacterium sp. AusDCA TaxID=3240383 RepID=UPI003DA72B91
MGETVVFDKNKLGLVFNIQHYSVHDGPGIRTIVFVKGCPLRCKWCSNPESQERYPQLGYNSNKCIGTKACFKCAEVCPYGAVKIDSSNENLKTEINREVCKECLLCAEVCPSKALEVFGKPTSVDDVLKEVEKDSIFYARSGGGLTFSGGEPLMQADFVAATLEEARRRRIKTTIETCGYADWPSVHQVCQHLNSVIWDIKCIDPEKHKKFTGVSNEIILNNFSKLCAEFPNLPKLVRTPIIPGFNDSEKDVKAIIDFIKDKPNVKYEILPYHRLGQPKYYYLGREYSLAGVQLDNERFNKLKEIVNSFN